jgi:hypothetical protein
VLQCGVGVDIVVQLQPEVNASPWCPEPHPGLAVLLQAAAAISCLCLYASRRSSRWGSSHPSAR